MYTCARCIIRRHISEIKGECDEKNVQSSIHHNEIIWQRTKATTHKEIIANATNTIFEYIIKYKNKVNLFIRDDFEQKQ